MTLEQKITELEQKITELEQQMSDLIQRVEMLEFPLYKFTTNPPVTPAAAITVSTKPPVIDVPANWPFPEPVTCEERAWPFPQGFPQ